MKETCGITVDEKLLKRFKSVIQEKKTDGKAIYSPYLEEALERYIKHLDKSPDEGREGGVYRDLSRTEKRKTEIVDQLKEYDKVGMRLIDDLIREVAGSSRPTLEKYRSLVWAELKEEYGFCEEEDGRLLVSSS